jgi:hypothetical protein
MFPALILYPIWLLIAVLYPVFMAFRAIKASDVEQMRLWTFYLCAGALLSLLWPVVEVVPYAVFSFLSLFIGDWHFEAHVFAAIALVNPKRPIIALIFKKLDEEADVITNLIRKRFDDLRTKLEEGPLGYVVVKNK